MLLNDEQSFALAQPINQLNTSKALSSQAISAELATIQLLSTLQELENLALTAESTANKTVIAQQSATQAASKAFKLSLCSVPKNPCLHGGLCSVYAESTNYTCFCSALWQGSSFN